jgi:cytochrome c
MIGKLWIGRWTLATLGAAVALSLAGQVPAQPSAGDVARGQGLFQDRCSMCHVLGGVGMGPDLTGVVGRKAGTFANFNYSPALKASGVTWTAANLDRFLTDPRAMVPGTAMRVKLIEPTDRHDLVAYLASLSKH